MRDQEMTIRELQESIWRELPAIRRQLIGRERINDLIAVSIEQSPVELFRHVTRSNHSQEIVLAAWGQSVKRGYCLMHESTDEKQFGPIFWLLIGPMLQILLSKLLDWYFRSPKNAGLMRGWKRNMTND
jgi:hypothetical protein